MFSQWINRIAESVSDASNAEQATSVDVERVSASLLVEIARADHQLDASEVQSIIAALQKASSLPNDEIVSIVDAAVVDADSAISLHEHVRLVNDHFEQPEKIMLIEQMWRVAAADGNIDRYEDYTIRKLSDLIYVRHSEFIKAKLRVIEG